MYNTVVIGAGPSGLMAAVQAAGAGADVTVIEQKDKPLKKLYATGNGRCNFTNLNMDGDVYRGSDPAFAYRIIDDFDRNDLILFFNNLGMTTKHIGDYVYPYNEQARTVAEALLLECRRLKVRIVCGEPVVNITRDESLNETPFTVITPSHEYRADKVIAAAGGLASPAHGSDGSLNPILEKLGHRFVAQRCALVPLTFRDRALSNLAGVRIKCSVYIIVGSRKAAGETGEIIINKDNVSGIPVMQLSRYGTEALSKGEKVSLSLDLFPEESNEELNFILDTAFGGYRYRPTDICDELLKKGTDRKRERSALEALGLSLNEKLALYCLRKAGIVPDSLSVNVPDKKIKALASLLKDLRIDITGDAGFDRSQVTAGGIDVSQLTDKLESRIVPGLYITGELCDIDGTCGGYNLQWAFSSGAVAGRASASKS